MEDRTIVHAGAPPPPSEVKVRTMKSDLASMARTGGGIPSFQNVAVDNLSIEKEYTTPSHAAALMKSTTETAPFNAGVEGPEAAVTNEVVPKKEIYPILIVAIVALLAIVGVGYFAYATFFAAPSASTSQNGTDAQPIGTLPAVATTTTATSSSPVVPPPASITAPPAELSSAHNSLFIKPADQVITISFTNATDTTTYRKTMAASLTAINAASTLIEIDPKASDGNDLSIQGILSVSGATILSPQALASFNPDATFFIYRDKSGLWPGYVITLNAGQTSNSAMANVKALETSGNIADLFLSDPGIPSSDGFTDSAVAGIPVRILPFSGSSIPLYVTYGWYQNYLIVSTSKNGFAAAIANL